MKITIDHISIEVTPGMTVMQAAGKAGIIIPSLCHLDGYLNRPSCMVCMVKDLDSGKLFPSCAYPVEDGMNLSASSEDVLEARKEALELLLSDHVGDCEAPCRLSCPAFMNIPLMNRLIAAGNIAEALQVVREEIALPLVLGYICPAPCENACRRKKVDAPVSICMLKRFTAADGKIRMTGLTPETGKTGKRIAVIGTGPAGLSAAFYLLRKGYDCVLYEKKELPGGALRYSIPDDILPKPMLDADIGCIRQLGAEFRVKTEVTSLVWEKEILPEFDAVILATGFREDHPVDGFGMKPFENGYLIDKKRYTSSLPGVFGCGSLISEQLLSVRSVAQGKKAALEAIAYVEKRDLRRRPFFNSLIGPMNGDELKEYLEESDPAGRVSPVMGYMEGFQPEEAIREASRCMHCDCRKPATCKLRLCADEYGANRKRFAAAERKQVIRNLQHDIVVYEPEKCIRCGLCIEITQKAGERLGLAYVGRGFDVRINAPFNGSLKEALEKTAEKCVEACPTGALALRAGEEVKR